MFSEGKWTNAGRTGVIVTHQDACRS